jgi:hypothetical protein
MKLGIIYNNILPEEQNFIGNMNWIINKNILPEVQTFISKSSNVANLTALLCGLVT